MQQDVARHLRHTLDHDLPPSAQAMLSEQAECTARMLSGMRTKLQAQEKEQHARIAIHHYHCDHLGTPMALTDQTGQVAWAAKLAPWGNVLQEYNPQGMYQAIRLPGQHHDRETGLYYKCNRFVHEVLESADVEYPSRYKFGPIPRGPATAGDWADSKKAISGFEVVNSPKPSDIVAVAYPYWNATGHVAVVAKNNITIGAGSKDGSHSTGWPWNGAPPKGNPIYRRCKD